MLVLLDRNDRLGDAIATHARVGAPLFSVLFPALSEC